MANSDNVVRVGLTPKYKDATTLLEIMDTTPQTPQVFDGDPVIGKDHVTRRLYATPAAEFEMRRWTLPLGSAATIDKGDVPAVLLIVEGEVDLAWAKGSATFRKGESALLPACLDAYTLHATADADVFQAAVPGTF